MLGRVDKFGGRRIRLQWRHTVAAAAAAITDAFRWRACTTPNRSVTTADDKIVATTCASLTGYNIYDGGALLFVLLTVKKIPNVNRDYIVVGGGGGDEKRANERRRLPVIHWLSYTPIGICRLAGIGVKGKKNAENWSSDDDDDNDKCSVRAWRVSAAVVGRLRDREDEEEEEDNATPRSNIFVSFFLIPKPRARVVYCLTEPRARRCFSLNPTAGPSDKTPG